MLITKNNGDDAFVQGIDTQSQVAIWAINHLNSRQISKLGLTHIPGGAADASGMKILRDTGCGLTLENNIAIEPIIVPLDGSQPLAPTLPQRELYNVPANNILLALNDMTKGFDPVYTANSLGLFKRIMDKVSGPKLCREFREPQIPVPGLFNMECRDAEGNFTGRYVLFNGSVFEAKIFKYTDSPDGAYFHFAPSKSAIYIPQNCNGCFTTNANIAVCNPGMGWLCTADGVENLDWEIIRRFGKSARLTSTVFPDDPLLTRNNFAEAFAIVTEAKRQGIEMKMLKATAREKKSGDFWEAEEELLPDQSVKKLARNYGIRIDPVWKNGLPGEIDFDEEPQVRQVTPFWDGNIFAEFYGKKSDEFMLELFSLVFSNWGPFDRIWLIIDSQDKQLAQKARRAVMTQLKVATFEIFDDLEGFQKEIWTESDLIFIVAPEKSIPDGVFDKCANMNVPIGIFSGKEEQNFLLEGYGVTKIIVKKISGSERVFCIKNMKNGKIEKCKFHLGAVIATPGTEDDMSKGE